MTNEIKGFSGYYRFLSNFYPSDVTYEDLTYKSSEAAYQAQKSLNLDVKKLFTVLDAREARRKGRAITVRKDWDDKKLNIMYKILRAKFSQEPLRGMLLDTKDAYLEETNWWHDRFWVFIMVKEKTIWVNY